MSVAVAVSLRFSVTYVSHPKTLIETSRPRRRRRRLSAEMKDRPLPSSCGAVYVPPHHRLRSVITSSNLSSSAPLVDSKTVLTQNNSSSIPRGNPYPYLTRQQFRQQQQMKNSQLDSADDLSEEGSDRDAKPSSNPGASTSDNMEAWKWKLTTLLRNKDKQEVVSRDKKDRRDFEQIVALASKMGLYSHLYIKVVVVSKEPLPWMRNVHRER
ncbi:DExH-box ATP-dependent RNA helicase [Actinidia chinensis var. chinensis]|uniref:DExH-box ATP-dependent RNA helicase n=1 Tax=Actinidia chinensis var. chinensis TaxID=1590841 RepID=A0A2R6PGW8_ACTCC|nr:DExH-box ATP-dependent RNA helicase [Actinidia chinensis var. chinensis]